MSNNITYVEYVGDCIFWETSKYDINKFMKYFRGGGISYNW